ncbi:aspartic proteinase nepenthesin-2-like [Papaver somniferum]|uniref:aspartic proteinase nepenthesin-2-like n=1 Tax=Papaver somniferum TaxID=3469 RepID=UPI000E6F9D96|nr:aspartic proteinase nepenthesin-2-like [Papaver somniferum]
MFSDGRGGPPSFMNYYLLIDSGSDYTWLQCEGAYPSFNQDAPLYPSHGSYTYQPQRCGNPPEPDCIDGYRTRSQAYGNGAVADIVLAADKFTFNSSAFMINMGCGFSQRNWDGVFCMNRQRGRPDFIAGVLGLGTGPWSLVIQLQEVSQGKFSYCLEEFDDNFFPGLNTYLRFGSDAYIGGGGQLVHATPILVPGLTTSLYFLALEDISVSNQKLRFRRGTFALRGPRNNRIGGTIIDSGAPFSALRRDSFDRVAQFVEQRFAQHGIDVLEENARYDFIFGAMQQVNKKILYDLNVAQLFFADQVCTQDR